MKARLTATLLCTACVSQTPLPGEGGESDGAKGAVLITEVTSQADDRIELRNMSEDSVDMDGWAVQDGDRSASKTWRFPDGTRLEPGERMVLIKGQHHAFGLGKADGVVLLDASGGVVDETTWPEGAAFPSWCRQPDDDDDFTTCSRASFGDGNPSLDEEDPQPEDLVAPKVVSSRNAEFVIDTPDELGFDSQGRLWVGVPPRREIVVLDTKGAVVATVGGPGTGPGEFEDDGGSGGPHAIRAFGDRVYATDRTGGRVNVYDANTLEAVGELVPPDFSDPKGLAIDRQGRIWVSDQGSDQVARMLPDGTVDTVIAPMEDAKLEDFSGDACRTPCNAETVALDETRGWLFVASADAGRIEVVDLETLQYTGQSIGEPFGGGTPKPGRVATEVEGLAVAEEAGLLFAVDEQIGRVLAYDLTSPDLFDPDADFATVGSFGHFGHENGEFSGPDGLVIGGNRMAIADQENDRVQIFELDDVIEHLTR